MTASTGKYQLIRKLAAGGMAEVFLARVAGPMGFEKTVVVKRILPHLADEENFISMFLSEARLAAQLNHPNVVQVFDFGEADGAYFLVMEFIDGVNLRVLFRKAMESKSPLAFPLAARIISLACEGLNYAHDFTDPATGEPMGLVHRDVSPDNILIARNGSVKVVDFGIAKAANQTNLTKTGTVKGKFSYMPPEQLTGQPLDKRADVFALGIVLFELITGRKPFDTSNEAFIVRAIMYEPLAPAAQFRPDVPEELQRILDKALAKSRDERYPDCRALQTDLERFIHNSGNPVAQHQLSQLVQTLAPAAPIPTPMPSAPLPPVQPQIAAATVEGIDVEFSTALLATPPPQPSIISLVPKAKPSQQPPPPPVPTQTFEAFPPGVIPNTTIPHVGGPTGNAPAPQPQFTPPAPQPRPSAPAAMTMPDLGAISLREESRETPAPLVPAKKSNALPIVLLLVSVVVGGGLTWFFTQRGGEAPKPVEPIAAVKPPDPEPVKQPEPVAVKPPEPEPVKPPEPEPVKPPDPVVAVKPPEPEPLKKPVVKKPPPIAKKPPPPAVGPKGQVEFRVRPFGAVWVDGNYLGETPFSPAALGVGNHTVRVVNRDLGKEVTKQLEVKEGSNVFRHNFEE